MVLCSGRCCLQADQGPGTKGKETEKGGKLGEKEEMHGRRKGKKEGWREKGERRERERERPFSQLICVEIKNRTCTSGFLQPSGIELMGKIVQKNAADPC